jgi:hypothetical protein
MPGGYTSQEKSQNGFSRHRRRLQGVLEILQFSQILQNTVAGFLCGVPAAYKYRNISGFPLDFFNFLN